MAEERDPRVSERYRHLGGEEPPRELDQAILAAAHRAADKPHAPLVAPAGRHRWYFSLAAAAVLMLAVGIALHVDRQQPDPEAVSIPTAPSPAANEERAPAAPPAADEAKPSRDSALMKNRRDAQPAEPPPVLADRAESAAAERKAEVDALAGARAAPKPAPMARSAPATANYLDRPAETADREVERIAELRRLGRDEEADKALAEFRKRYPDYRISEEMRSKVERARAR